MLEFGRELLLSLSFFPHVQCGVCDLLTTPQGCDPVASTDLSGRWCLGVQYMFGLELECLLYLFANIS